MPTLEHPNLVVVMSDDHAQWALGPYGNREVRTPAMDHLARRGVTLANAFTPTPVCSPARASFWTGRMPSQHGVHDFIGSPERGIPEREWLDGEVTLAQVLRDSGYQTALVGKWHLGGQDPQPGFDYWFRQEGRRVLPDAVWPRSLLPSVDRASVVERAPADGSVERFLAADPAYDRHAITDQAVAFLRQSSPARPFFLFVGYTATHSPWTGHPSRLLDQHRAMSDRDVPGGDLPSGYSRFGEALFSETGDPVRALTEYYAAVEEIDEGLGRLLDELDRLDLTGDTVVVYTSDHGLNCGQHGIWGKGNATRPLNMFDESILVPAIWSRPGWMREGAVCDSFVSHVDAFSTLIELAGATLPRSAEPYPGHSFVDALRDQAASPRNQVFGEYGDVRMLRTRDYKLIQRPLDASVQLFDLEADPDESTDISSTKDGAPVAAAMVDDIERYFARIEKPEHSGLRVRELPRHNPVEAWR